jgi:FMN phosphatase YigB (HAD superfamily)/glycosyltransferase involved in cell wall biosynthesis
VILAGEGSLDTDLPLHLVPGLAYRNEGGEDAAGLLQSIHKAAATALGNPPDVWHFHNHSLGKNPALCRVVSLLAEENQRLVLQLHDLAEDGRPSDYQNIAGCTHLYPFGPRIRYVFLNTRDRNVFTAAGLPERNSHVGINPIECVKIPPPDDGCPPLVFAPIRGIRRKNIGELVFLSALAPQGSRFAISRAPENPSALAIHETWRRFAASQRLPIEFDVTDRIPPAQGAAADFASWIAHSTHWASSSVAEGFGLPFLEAIACGRPLLGRNLPHVSAEHQPHGIRTGDLYDQLLVPAEWVDATILRDHLFTTLERNHRAWQRPLTRRIRDAVLDSLFHGDRLDFGNLPEALQQGVIERIAEPGCRRVPTIKTANDSLPAFEWLALALANRTPAASPRQLAPYSQDAWLDALREIHQELPGHAPGGIAYLPPERILDAFLTPDSFHFLRSALPPPAPVFPYKAVVFDIYGTLLVSRGGAVKPDPEIDATLRRIIREFGHPPPSSPSTAIHDAVTRHHANAGVSFPEVDLRVMWRDVLGLEPGTDMQPLVEAIEAAWHPVTPMPGAEQLIGHLSTTGVSLGLLSNGQCNTLSDLGGISSLFAPELILLSYQQGIAKPSPELFQTLTNRLAGRGITPEETLYVGNDPVQDILPAAAAGFTTALFTGHPDSLRIGTCKPDMEIRQWGELLLSHSKKPQSD